MNKTKLTTAICLVLATIIGMNLTANGGYGRKAQQGQQVEQKQGQTGNRRQQRRENRKGNRDNRRRGKGECKGGTCKIKQSTTATPAVAQAQ